MKSIVTRAVLLLIAAALSWASILNSQGEIEETIQPIQYSTIGHGPKILLLHDSSNADQDWAKTARCLASRFEVTLVDISQFLDDHQGVQLLRQAIRELEIDDSHISGSANGKAIALRYALSFPEQSNHFILPESSEDLQILADIVNSTHFSKS
ncbi:alpha/beta hydrolase [Pelagicoccus sp. SDUM812002]|uniref:alpha/beta fold hydrolase n=1 Tax=Pelagicoccus sp. SDUM812002 TaxID=3041266 RepID=UPI0028107E66|nr:alpha/beta hydrolase [Pelagicoccus sp. SDUM812002]MDQ8184869.1 alpha/beta hydrolase [Pelagicoccus sp. SDUM812002]